MSVTITTQTTFNIEHCCSCGMQFALTADFQRKRREDHKSFYCPAGHAQSYTGETEAEKIRRERDRLKQDQARLEEDNKAAWATANAQVERARKAEAANKLLKKRSSAGTCPCCTRTFSNMATHMKRQHPEFVAEGGAKVVPFKAEAVK